MENFSPIYRHQMMHLSRVTLPICPSPGSHPGSLALCWHFQGYRKCFRGVQLGVRPDSPLLPTALCDWPSPRVSSRRLQRAKAHERTHRQSVSPLWTSQDHPTLASWPFQQSAGEQTAFRTIPGLSGTSRTFKDSVLTGYRKKLLDKDRLRLEKGTQVRLPGGWRFRPWAAASRPSCLSLDHGFSVLQVDTMEKRKW